MSLKLDLGKVLFLILLLTLGTMVALAGNVKGTITDRQNREPLTGATVQVEGTTLGTVADIDGHYLLTLKPGTYTLSVKYVGYKEIRMPQVKVERDELILDFALESDAQALGEVSVTAQAKRNNENALIQEQRGSYKSYLDMENSLYGPYDIANDRPVLLRKATDNQYSSDVRLGALLNLTYQPRDRRHRSFAQPIASRISCSSSGLNAVFCRALRLLASCSTELAPTMTLVTKSSFSSQARAISARV